MLISFAAAISILMHKYLASVRVWRSLLPRRRLLIWSDFWLWTIGVGSIVEDEETPPPPVAVDGVSSPGQRSVWLAFYEWVAVCALAAACFVYLFKSFAKVVLATVAFFVCLSCSNCWRIVKLKFKYMWRAGCTDNDRISRVFHALPSKQKFAISKLVKSQPIKK